jgi:hypothetical protein
VPSGAKSSNLKTARGTISSSSHIVTVSNNPKENPHYMGITFSSDDPERRTAILILQLAHVDFGRYRSCGFALGQHSAFASFALFDRHQFYCARGHNRLMPHCDEIAPVLSSRPEGDLHPPAAHLAPNMRATCRESHEARMASPTARAILEGGYLIGGHHLVRSNQRVRVAGHPPQRRSDVYHPGVGEAGCQLFVCISG